MTKKIVRVCDSSIKEFNAGKGTLKVQGLPFDIDYDINNSSEVYINNEILEGARLISLNTDKVLIDIDEVTNVTKAQRKALKDGSLLVANGKVKGLECEITYNKVEKEFYSNFNIELVLYN